MEWNANDGHVCGLEHEMRTVRVLDRCPTLQKDFSLENESLCRVVEQKKEGSGAQESNHSGSAKPACKVAGPD